MTQMAPNGSQTMGVARTSTSDSVRTVDIAARKMNPQRTIVLINTLYSPRCPIGTRYPRLAARSEYSTMLKGIPR
jgi:hypothetical protein